MNETIKKQAKLGRGFIAALSVLFVCAVLAVGYMLYFGLMRPEFFNKHGQWGDLFGGTLNPLLTFLTFSGVLVTIILQKLELSLTREELSRSADALESQISASEDQSFESTFFQMLNLHNVILNSIDLVNHETGNIIRGRDCFRTYYTKLNKLYRANEKKWKGKRASRKILDISYYLFWKDAQLDLGHYYRYLYNIIRYVKNSGRDGGYYIALIRAQLSDQELLLLFYNCLSKQGEKFAAFAEEYALFDNMPVVRLLDREHQEWVDPRAFGSNPGPVTRV